MVKKKAQMPPRNYLKWVEDMYGKAYVLTKWHIRESSYSSVCWASVERARIYDTVIIWPYEPTEGYRRRVCRLFPKAQHITHLVEQ